MTDTLQLPRCRVCGVPLVPETGVAFRAGERVLFVTCQAHAQIASDGAHLLVKLATKGVRLFLEEKAPALFDALQDGYETHRERKEQQA